MNEKNRNRLAEQLLNMTEKPCTNKGCNEMIKRIQFKEHVLEKCPFVAVRCKYEKLGCEWSGTKNEKEQHQNECTITLDKALEKFLSVEQENKKLDKATREFDEYLTKIPLECQMNDEITLCHFYWSHEENQDNFCVNSGYSGHTDTSSPFGANTAYGEIKTCSVGGEFGRYHDIKFKLSWKLEVGWFHDLGERRLTTFMREIGYKEHKVNVIVSDDGWRKIEITLNEERINVSQLQRLRERGYALLAIVMYED